MRQNIFKILFFGYGFSLEYAKAKKKKGYPKFKIDFYSDATVDLALRVRVFYTRRFIARLHLNR